MQIMYKLSKSFENPILLPESDNVWDANAAFNPCVIKENDTYHMVYRAQSEKSNHFGNILELSTIGHTTATDGIHFQGKNKLVKPEYDWEKYGCEDPRITKVGKDYFIFYTALSKFPFTAEGIKVALAITRDFKTVTEKHEVTPFNAKGMVLFPEKVNGKYVAMLTVNTDTPPSTIGIAYFDKIEDIWSKEYWDDWYSHLEDHRIDLLRDPNHQIEVGAPPIKTDKGWLMIYAYIKEYFGVDRKFAIESALLDINDPKKIIARTDDSILTPTEEYEMYGLVPYTIFPSGAVLDGNNLMVYYGSCDTTGCVATGKLDELIDEMITPNNEHLKEKISLIRCPKNPIISPISDHDWENKYTYNPGAIYLNDKVHIIYRAQGTDDTSVFGYASTTDGETILNRLDKPIYLPREEFEIKKKAGFSGCEDPRLTLFEDNIYMFYTAYDAINHTKIAMTSIKKDDFLKQNWNWAKPVLVSSKDVNDKNACLLQEKIDNKYVLFHRTNHAIWIDQTDTLDFSDGRWIQGDILLEPKDDTWYSEKVGIAAPPIKTDKGWLLIFHALSKYDLKYRLGAMLLEHQNPTKIIKMLDYPILEPDAEYENNGFRPGTVFSCGAAVLKNKLFVYYGAGDMSVAVASTDFDKLMDALSVD